MIEFLFATVILKKYGIHDILSKIINFPCKNKKLENFVWKIKNLAEYVMDLHFVIKKNEKATYNKFYLLRIRTSIF